MRRLLFSVLIFISLSLFAWDIPKFTGRVVDNAKLLSSEEKSKIERAIAVLENETGVQMAVLSIPSLGGENLEEYSLCVANSWGLGSRVENDGLLLLISRNDRKIRLEVGTGLETKFSNKNAKFIVDAMAVDFKRNHYSEGICFAVGKIKYILTGDATKISFLKRVKKFYNSVSDAMAYVWIILFLFLPGIFYWIVWFFCLRDSDDFHISSAGAFTITDRMTRNAFRRVPNQAIGGFNSSGRISSGGSLGGRGRFGGGGASGGW